MAVQAPPGYLFVILKSFLYIFLPRSTWASYDENVLIRVADARDDGKETGLGNEKETWVWSTKQVPRNNISKKKK